MNIAPPEELRRYLPDDSARRREKSQGATGRKRLLLHCMVVALVCSLHHWTGIVVNRGDYTPFAVSAAVSAVTIDETHAYAPPARRFLLTGRIPAEVDNYERRNASAGIPFALAAILGSTGWLLGGLERAFILADALFPACLFLLLYCFTAEMIEGQALRLLVAWSTILIPFGFKNAFWLGSDPFTAPLEVTRTPQPELSFLFLMGAVALTGRAIQEKAGYWWIIGAGIASGLLFYSYYFYAIGWMLAMLLLIAFALAWKCRDTAWKAASIFGLMAVTAIPYALVSMHARREGGQTYLLERMGMYTHAPTVRYLLAGVVLSAALLFAGRRFLHGQPFHARYLALACLILGGVWGVNFQIISGYDAQHWHFWKRLVGPAGFFLLASFACRMAEHLWKGHQQRLEMLGSLLAVCLILNAAARQCYSAVQIAPAQRASNPRIEILTWARQHLPAGRVLGTVDPNLILLIPALTADYTYVPSGLRSLSPTDEIVARYDELAAWLDLSDGDLAQIVRAPRHSAPSQAQLFFVLRLYDGSETNWSAGQAASSNTMRPIEHSVLSAAFLQKYRWFCAETPGRGVGARLDNLIWPAQVPWPAPTAQTFPRARAIHANREFTLIELVP